jgi:hypothetical protein
MGGEAMKDVTSIFMAIVMVGLAAVIVSRNSNTTGVINSSSSAFNTGLATAEAPVTGYTPGPPIYANQAGSLAEFSQPEFGSGSSFGMG